MLSFGMLKYAHDTCARKYSTCCARPQEFARDARTPTGGRGTRRAPVYACRYRRCQPTACRSVYEDAGCPLLTYRTIMGVPVIADVIKEHSARRCHEVYARCNARGQTFSRFNRHPATKSTQKGPLGQKDCSCVVIAATNVARCCVSIALAA